MSVAEKVNRRLIEFEPNFLAMVDREVTLESIRKTFNDILKPLGARAVFHRSGHNGKHFLMLTGEFNSDWPRNKQIKIFIHCRPGEKTIEMKYDAVNNLWHQLAMLTAHELIHVEQHKTRLAKGVDPEKIYLAPFTTRKRLTPARSDNIQYLRDLDEIDSYGYELAYEIKRFYPKVSASKVLSTISRRRKLETYDFYKLCFKGHNWSKIQKRLLRRAYKWLPHITLVPTLPKVTEK